MIVLTVDGIIGQGRRKNLEDYHIKHITSYEQSFVTNVMMVLKIEPDDDEKFVFDILSRIKNRFLSTNVYDEKIGRFQIFETLTPDVLKTFMEEY